MQSGADFTSEAMPAILLDTCAILYLATGAPISKSAESSIVAAALSGEVIVSPISAWEIGMLAAKRRVQFSIDPKAWFLLFLMRDGLQLTPLEPEAAVDASFLPTPFHGDPADRLLVATARHLDIPLVTRDHRILAYGKDGHVKTIEC